MVDVDESQTPEKFTPGALLLAARERAGLSREQVAKELYMTVSKVTALETDDYGRLISDTFARGYIRAYASLLKLDVPAVLATYDALVGEEKGPVKAASEVPQANRKATETGQKGAWQFLAVIVAFLVGLWLISVWFFDNRTDKQEETRYLVPSPGISPVVIPPEEIARMQAAASAAASSVASLPASLASSSAGLQAGANIQVATSSAVSSAPAGTLVPAVVASQAANTSVSSAASSSETLVKKIPLDEISFSFGAECWLEVSDSRGDVLATELQPAGSKIKLIGQAPFDVKLGNAPAVEIQLNGKKIDVIPLLGTNVLIMKVGN